MAFEVRELDLSVPNQFYEQEARTKRLVVLLPGAGYNCDMPLLYFCTEVALEKGCDVLQFRYDSTKANLPQDELKSQITASLRKALAGRPWDTIILIGKSMGTQVMKTVLESDVLNGYTVMPIWLTPTLKREEVVEGIQKFPGLVVIGTKDHHFVQKKLDALSASRVEKIPGADHSLEFPGEFEKSIACLQGISKMIAESLS